MSNAVSKPSTAHLKAAIFITVLMFIFAGTQEATNKYFGIYLNKDRVPLKYSVVEFSDMVSDRFVLFRELTSGHIVAGKAQLPSDVEKTLGTQEYLSWIYLDRKLSKERGKAVCIRFHMAYYTDLLDAVPHVPDNCMVAGGMRPDRGNTGYANFKLDVRDPQWSQWSEIEMRQSSFTNPKKQGAPLTVVYYCFSVNGEPMCRRNQIRFALGSPFKKYFYYMKIELSAFTLDNTDLTIEEKQHICRDFLNDASDEIFAMIASKSEVEALEKSEK